MTKYYIKMIKKKISKKNEIKKKREKKCSYTTLHFLFYEKMFDSLKNYIHKQYITIYVGLEI